jgi:predicted TIM-barrel fold metal-dependent hydrolase
MKNGVSRSQEIRARLSHPIVDADGHTAEFEPAFFDYLKAIAGASAVERFKTLENGPFANRWHKLSVEERHRQRAIRPHWWVHPTKNTLDRATSSLPKLQHQRLDEMGIDFAVIYPSMGLFALHMADDELRRASCRAYNELNSDIYREYSDRLTPVAIIPMHTPGEAIEELEYAVGKRGMKASLMASFVRRPIAAASAESRRYASWLDTLALDSEYDYDPVWAKCVELKVSPSFHSPSAGIGFRTSTSNFMYNHIGHFAASAEAICKSLFFGGVPRRFPALRFCFLEGGIAWACTLLNDLASHWEKHGVQALENVDPASLDHALLRELFAKYGEQYGEHRLNPESERSQLLWGSPENASELDEWARCGLKRKDDLHALFAAPFYFGCEGDDRMMALAFDKRMNPLGCKLNAIYGSDIGHFDLPDMRDAAKEAYELVEDGLITEEDFRDFVFVNPVKFLGALNDQFFKNTCVEHEAEKVLVANRSHPTGARAPAFPRSGG